MNSIRRRLLLRLLIGIGGLLCATALVVYLGSQDEIGELYDAQLQRAAYAFQHVPGAEAGQPDSIPPTGSITDNPLAGLAVEVRVPGRSDPLYRSVSHVRLPRQIHDGWSTIQMHGQHWRVYSVALHGRRVIAAQPLSVRRDAAADIAVEALVPLAIALLLVAIVVWRVVGGELRPLENTARAVRSRSSTDLTPLPLADMPQELAPLIASFNDLMARLQAVLEQQKDFVADAAHELLTPLTALQLQMQWLGRATSSAQRTDAEADLRAGLARAIHLARQLMTLARQDPEAATPGETVDLAMLVHETVAGHAALAQARGVELGLGLGQVTAVTVTGDPHGLQILLDNLVDNAIKYTAGNAHRRGRVNIGVSGDDTGVVLHVEDSGPGIPAADLTRVFDRFYRRPGEETTGSGLGLAIACKIAARHGAVLSLSNGGTLGGLVAECRFPAYS